MNMVNKMELLGIDIGDSPGIELGKFTRGYTARK
jgi:hypothetical protein